MDIRSLLSVHLGRTRADDRWHPDTLYRFDRTTDWDLPPASCRSLFHEAHLRPRSGLTTEPSAGLHRGATRFSFAEPPAKLVTKAPKASETHQPTQTPPGSRFGSESPFQSLRVAILAFMLC
jgi:hypothetical protein